MCHRAASGLEEHTWLEGGTLAASQAVAEDTLLGNDTLMVEMPTFCRLPPSKLKEI